MKTTRIIPRLDIKGPNLVKGIHLEGLRVLGQPEDFARYYYENGADELMYQDVVASLYERNSLEDIISKTAKEIFIPLTVGGGLRTLEDIRKVLRAGADKVSLNTAAVKSPELVRNASRIFGSSTIVVALEIIKQPDGKFLCYTDNGREYTGIDAIDWAKKMEEMGAGELIITSVDMDGTGDGFDATIIEKIASSISIPVIAHGGAGKKEHIKDVLNNTSVDAVALASILHYEFIGRSNDHDFSQSEGNFEFLKNKSELKRISEIGIEDLKEFLYENGINCRIDFSKNP